MWQKNFIRRLCASNPHDSEKSWDIKTEKCCFTHLSRYTEHNPHKHPDKEKSDKCTTIFPLPKTRKLVLCCWSTTQGFCSNNRLICNCVISNCPLLLQPSLDDGKGCEWQETGRWAGRETTKADWDFPPCHVWSMLPLKMTEIREEKVTWKIFLEVQECFLQYLLHYLNHF